MEEKEWTAMRIINSSNVTTPVDLSSNPTQHLSELVLQPYSLEYGTYEFTLTVNFIVMIPSQGNITQTNRISTNLVIISTGLVVYGIENGVNGLVIGISQELVLNPLMYSFDLDNSISTSDLDFLFYCSTTANNIMAYDDLRKLKNNFLHGIISNNTCFDSISKCIMGLCLSPV